MQLPSMSLGGAISKGTIATLLFISGISNATAADSGATIARVANPDLRITEVLPDQAPSAGVPGGDWWELTSFAATPVDLSGWRFNDNGGGLDTPFVIPAGLTINPGESIIFAEETTPEEFTSWWGVGNLPAGLKIVNYVGSGLGLGTGGDGIRLWNATTTDPSDLVASIDYGASTQGVSFNYNPTTGVFGELSVLGVNGVIQAALATDIGSPGRITGASNPPTRPELNITRLENGQVQIQFASEAGRTYTLEAATEITGAGTMAWSSTGMTTNASGTTASFTVDAAGSHRFFRVRVE
ncbi:MAG: lamin tail domain-containing protein [Verrucomicrobiales bacterium]